MAGPAMRPTHRPINGRRAIAGRSRSLPSPASHSSSVERAISPFDSGMVDTRRLARFAGAEPCEHILGGERGARKHQHRLQLRQLQRRGEDFPETPHPARALNRRRPARRHRLPAQPPSAADRRAIDRWRARAGAAPLPASAEPPPRPAPAGNRLSKVKWPSVSPRTRSASARAAFSNEILVAGSRRLGARTVHVEP